MAVYVLSLLMRYIDYNDTILFLSYFKSIQMHNFPLPSSCTLYNLRHLTYNSSCFSSFFSSSFSTNLGSGWLQVLNSHSPSSFSTGGPCPASCQIPPLKSGMHIILTTRLVHPVKCCVRCPSPVSGLYCSHAKPDSLQALKTVLMTLRRRPE
jgi:hypothetical protein